MLPILGMLTFQAAGTASRSDQRPGSLAVDRVAPFIDILKDGFDGTLQLQGGIKTNTMMH